MVEFFVPGKPVPKGRPRFGNGRTYTPAKTRAWEENVAWTGRIAMLTPPLEGKLRVTLLFSGAHGSADIDNLAKAVLDGCNGVCYSDDRQVSELVASRYVGSQPGVSVTIEALG